jgi:hypothetical protein
VQIYNHSILGHFTSIFYLRVVEDISNSLVAVTTAEGITHLLMQLDLVGCKETITRMDK